MISTNAFSYAISPIVIDLCVLSAFLWQHVAGSKKDANAA